MPAALDAASVSCSVASVLRDWPGSGWRRPLSRKRVQARLKPRKVSVIAHSVLNEEAMNILSNGHAFMPTILFSRYIAEVSHTAWLN
jgi:hypothetical protein